MLKEFAFDKLPVTPDEQSYCQAISKTVKTNQAMGFSSREQRRASIVCNPSLCASLDPESMLLMMK